MRARAHLRVEAAVQRQRVRWRQAWPVVLRPTGDRRVHLVHAAGGPLGGDDLALEADLAAGTALEVRSAGATLVQPGPGALAGAPARWEVAVRVGAGAQLDWAPEPTVVADGAALDSRLRVELAAGACALVHELAVLGRHGQRGGRYRGALAVVVDGVPLLLHTTVLDGADPALCGPAGTAGARAVGTLVVAGRPARTGAGERTAVRWAWSGLDGPGAVLLAVGEPGAVGEVLSRARDEVLGAARAQDPLTAP